MFCTPVTWIGCWQEVRRTVVLFPARGKSFSSTPILQQPASYSIGTMSPFCGGKAIEDWGWTLGPTQRRSDEYVELYLCSSLFLHEKYRDNFFCINSMQQNPSLEACICSAGQELPNFLSLKIGAATYSEFWVQKNRRIHIQQAYNFSSSCFLCITRLQIL